ncbi:MAG: hypothetical protein GY749_38570 [Desulfobacteraceae bacterium]|nr:hypothetical protein [Desulfobacteraceae bacterium]
MINFHSPLLKKIPRATDQERVALMIKRILITTPVAVLILVGILSVKWEILDKNGWSIFLYHIHDKYYLWAKGYFYTLFYPDSIIWLGLISTILILWLISFLGVKSRTRQWHIKLIKNTIERTHLHPCLIYTTHCFKRAGLKQQLLFEVTRHERISALNHLTASSPGQADYTKCSHVSDLTLLYIRLLLIHRPETSDRMDAAACFHEAFFQLKQYGDKNAKWLPSLINTLTGILDEILSPIFDYKDHKQFQESREKQKHITREDIAKDILLSASLTDAKIAEKILGKDIAAQPCEIVKKIVRTWLAESVNARRAILDEIRSRFETKTFRMHHRSLQPDTNESLPLVQGTKKELRPMGKLTLGLALDLAVQAHMPEIALAYIDIFEALAFISEIAEHDLDNKTAEMAYKISVFISDMPNPGDYRICAELTAAKLDTLEGEWKQSLFSKDGIIGPEDFALARTQVASLYHASGPEFDAFDTDSFAREPE